MVVLGGWVFASGRGTPVRPQHNQGVEAHHTRAMYIGTTLETTQGQIDGFFSQLLFKCYPPEVASVGD